MTEVTFVASIQDHQTERVRRTAERLRAHRPDLTVTIAEGEVAKALLAKHRLNFGPAILIDGRLEYVGIPRWGFLQERLAQIARGLPNPRTAAPPTPAKPASASPTSAKAESADTKGSDAAS
ncbi:MAG: hypothetical protein HY557_02910 [Euryarchaeota archaeon]|nr:hypothetical protein [Euryarchaeota archaeon]